jgi:pimeloyl-ACP methyl ester carboxylesterase
MIAWTGTYAVPAGTDPVAISVQVSGHRATVAFGGGHAVSTTVALGQAGTRVRFSFPGLPSNLVFDGTVKRRVWAGTVGQGKLRGSFRLRRGLSRILPLLGLYRGPSGTGLTIVQPLAGLSPWIVELPSGATHGIGPALTVGDRLGETSGNGRIAADAKGFTWNGTHYARVVLRQREVRVGVDAATLTLPPGAGPFPAAAMVHGSGAQTRSEFQVFAAYCELLGIAVLADDKRGVGQSSGSYPGDLATDATIEALAHDAEVEARFLAKLPHIDPKRVGLFGDSQAGWVIAYAAAHEAAVRWAVPVVGPTVTVGQTDFWAGLAGQSESPPSGSQSEMLKQTRAAGSFGFDPRPWLAKLTIPVFWTFGADDRNVPTVLCVEALEALKPGHDFSWVVLPTTHTPIVLPTGLLSSLPQSPGFHPDFFPAIGSWLRSHGILG